MEMKRRDISIRVGARIRELRLAKRWSLDDLAARTRPHGLVKSQLGKIELGAPRTALDQYAVIAAALGVSHLALFDVVSPSSRQESTTGRKVKNPVSINP